MNYDEDTILDWSGKNVVIKSGGHIMVDSTEETGPLSLTIITNCSLTIESGGKITADGSSGSQAQRKAGTINLDAPDITIGGKVSTNSESGWSPEGGTINIDATNLNLTTSGKILSEVKTLSDSDGYAGTINIQATDKYDHQGRISVNVNGFNWIDEQLYAGTVTITGAEFTNKGKITADTYGLNGHAGNININIQNTSSNANTTIYANCWLWEGWRMAGQGGQVFMKANQLDIKNSKVEAIDNGSHPGTINLEYCTKDFTGTSFNPTPDETVSCP